MSGVLRTEWRGGEHRGRNTQLRIILAFTVIFVVLAAVAVGIALLAAPPGVQPVCRTPGCAAPPHAPSPGGIGTSGAVTPARGRVLQGTSAAAGGAAAGGAAGANPAVANAAAAFTNGGPTYTSPGLGFSFEYPQGLEVGSSSSNQVVLVNGSSPDLIVYALGVPVTSGTPQDMQRTILSNLGQRIPNLAEVDPNSAEAIPAAELGGHAGVGGFFQGYVDSPNGPQTPVDLAVLAASDGRQTLGVAIESLNRARTQGRMGFLDQSMLDSFRFAGDIAR